MKRFLKQSLLVFIVLIAGGTQAEIVPYAVDDYIPVLFKDARLVVGGSLSFDGSGNTQSNDSAGGSPYIYQSSDYQRDNFTFGSDLSYQRRYTTVQKWYEYSGEINADFRTQKTTDVASYTYNPQYSVTGEYEGKSTNFNPYVYNTFDLGTYFSGDFSLSGRGSLDWRYNKTSTNDQDNFQQSVNVVGNNATRSTTINAVEQPGDSKGANLTVELLLGQGRMYDGVFAFTAISMIEELQRKGLLARMPSREEMAALTEIVYQNRLLHSIDFRIRKIEIIEELTTYLAEKGIVEASSPMMTPVVRDVWDYFPTASREFGLMVRGGFGIRYDYSSSQSTQKSKYRELEETYDINDPGNVTVISDDLTESQQSNHYKRTGSFPYVTLIVEKNQPLSTRVQLNLAAQGWIYFSSSDSSYTDYRVYDGDVLQSSSSDNNSREYESITSFALSGQLYYLFDNRTTASVSMSYQRHDYDQTLIDAYYYNDVFQYGDTVVSDIGGYGLSLGASLEYRISIPTTIGGSIYYYKNTASLFSSTTGKYEYDNYYFRVSINHYLF